MKRFTICLTAFLACLFIIIPKTIYANTPDLTIEATYGINENGIGKVYHPINMKLQVTNNGEDFSGYILTGFEQLDQLNTAKVYALNVAGHSTETINVQLSSYPEQAYYNNRNPQFLVYEGEIVEKNKVDTVKIINNKPTLYEMDAMIVSTLNDETLLTTFKTMKTDGYGVIVPILLNEMPSDVSALAMIDIISLSKGTLNSLSETEQQLLEKWIFYGGKFVVDYSLKDTIFEHKAPLSYENGTTEVTQDELLKYTQKNGSFSESIFVQNSVLNPLAQAEKIDEKIVSGVMKVGNGQIVQTAYSLKDESLLQMDGYNYLVAYSTRALENYYGAEQYWGLNNIASTIGDANEYFKSFRYSPIVIVALFAFYIAIVGPLLYLFLKKRDKREQAWIYLPVIAILFSVVLFLVGGRERLLQTQLQEIGVYIVDDTNQPVVNFAQSILTQKAGDYVFKIEKDVDASSYKSYTGFTRGNLDRLSTFEERESDSILTLRDVPFWSVDSIVGRQEGKYEGDLEHKLSVKDGKVIGTIRNTLPYTLHNIQLFSLNETISLGDLASGEEREINEAIEVGYLTAPNWSNYTYYDSRQSDDINEMREKAAKLLIAQSPTVQGNAVFIAEINEMNLPATLQQKAKKSSVVYFARPISPITNVEGNVTVKNEQFLRQIFYDENVQYPDIIESSTNEWYLNQGKSEMEFILPTPFLNKRSWSTLQIENSAPLSLRIYNQKDKQFEAIIMNNVTLNNVDDYISSTGSIRIELLNNTDDYGTSSQLPKLTLKGVFAND